MNNTLNTLNTLAAAPAQAPNAGAGQFVAGGGATLVGLILAALIISHWKKLAAETKKYAVMSMLMVACLAGAGGVLGGLIESAKTTGSTVGTTLTQTTTGQ